MARHPCESTCARACEELLAVSCFCGGLSPRLCGLLPPACGLFPAKSVTVLKKWGVQASPVITLFPILVCRGSERVLSQPSHQSRKCWEVYKRASVEQREVDSFLLPACLIEASSSMCCNSLFMKRLRVGEKSSHCAQTCLRIRACVTPRYSLYV